MDAIAIHLSVARGSAFIGVHLRQHVGAFWNVTEEVKEAVGILPIGDRGRLKRMNHVRKLDGIPNKEDWEVVAY